MPIYEITCTACDYSGEVIALNADGPLACPSCGSTDTRKLMSATSSMTGKSSPAFPGPGDTTCCGKRPPEASCAGPGSCCGKTF